MPPLTKRLRTNSRKADSKRSKTSTAKLNSARTVSNRNRPAPVYRSVNLGTGFPSTTKITHKYADLSSLTSTTGSTVTYVFSCNGMYDPNITGTGHQPMYFDQMSALYDHYTVIGSRLKISWLPEAITGNDRAVCGVFVNDDTSTTPTILGLIEQNSSKVLYFSPTSSGEQILYSYWSPKKTFGIDQVTGLSNFQGTSSSNPTEQSTWTLFYQNVAAATSTVFFQVEIEYIAMWTELKDVATS